RIFRERVAQLPDKLKQYVSGLNPQPYGRAIVSRFPAMLAKLAAYTRSGSEPDHAVLRCYLPGVAGHNLLMAAELTLAESPTGAARVAATNSATSGGASNAPMKMSDRLAKKTSLRFAKDTLEAAL